MSTDVANPDAQPGSFGTALLASRAIGRYGGLT
jgi:hypothetical protein